eukprot:c10191_g1_i1.p1 GENE.c10191_g1_i1~~c10191_g1_i1.p1  ORF type:complete len:115 (-),score=25.15 c10191_g1_i1:30-374(-)
MGVDCSKQAMTDRTFSLAELSQYNGVIRQEIYLAVDGIVFDVTNAEFYRPGGGYHLFAGNDATFCLATMSLDAKNVGKMDFDLDDEQKTVLADWVKKLSSKYPIVGRLILTSGL